ncbi:hypothetical protein K2Q16_00480 [Patescibacteria group bacterium]|nr:hypothetical protein [Patescibacteria group bacterium]
MKISMSSNRTLESSKLFPLFAWALVILFALFVYVLANTLADVTLAINANTQQLSDFNASLEDIKQVPNLEIGPSKITMCCFLTGRLTQPRS